MAIVDRVGLVLCAALIALQCAASPEQARTQEKMERVQQGMQQWVTEGRDVEPVAALLRQVEPLAREGRASEVEQVLDQALAKLAEPAPAAAPRAAASAGGPVLSAAAAVRLTPIPAGAELIFHQNGQIWVMDRNGGRVTQITFGVPRKYEHAAVSRDHRFVVADVFEGDRARLWLYDLRDGVERRLLPDFYHAGDGGVDWDRDGFVYFVGKETSSQRHKDLYRVRADGTGLQRLTDTPARDECDPSVSEDSRTVTYCVLVPEPARNSAHTEVWSVGTDGAGAHAVYVAGQVFKASAHDPELAPDGRSAVFSKVDSDVPPNYPNDPAANTAHDILSVDVASGRLTRLTRPGPISIIPDEKNGLVVYTEISERAAYQGACVVDATDPDQTPRRIRRGANSVKWIP
jgi:hypothetical protein